LVTVSTKILSGTELIRVIWERRCYHHGRIVVIGLKQVKQTAREGC